jgi:hypothetical protein
MSDLLAPYRINPYLGPRPFQSGERLYGREQDVAAVINRLIAQKVLLLFSASGVGKTSLIQAGVIPEMQQRGFMILPTVRLSHQAGGMLGEPDNRFVFSTLLSLEAGRSDPQITSDKLAQVSIPEYFNRIFSDHAQKESSGRGGVLLIFDQFEEVLLIDPQARDAKQAFFSQLMDVLLDDRVRALFAIREEYLAGLEPYLIYFPARLSSRYRLDLFSPEQAVEALVRPAQEVGIVFEGAAAEKLVDDLRIVTVQTSDGSLQYKLGEVVEPLQLQIVGHSLFERTRADPSRITLEDIEDVGNIDQTLSQNYDKIVREAAVLSGMNERWLRGWIAEALITPQGTRTQVLEGEEAKYDIDRVAVDALIRAYLVRAEKRRGMTWYELVNDRLIGPIVRSNNDWFEQNLTLLQRQAALWEREGRPGRLLLSDTDLREAETWSAANPDQVSQVELDFLSASRSRELDATEAGGSQAASSRYQRTIRILFILLFAVLLLAIAGWAVVFWLMC